MKKNFIRLATVVASLLICCNSVSAKTRVTETSKVYVTASALNIRQTAGTELERIDVVPYGTELELIGKTEIENWSQILYDGELRYVCDKYISEEKPEEKKQ